MATVYLALGSNLGDRQANICNSLIKLEENGVKVLQLSSIIETDPVGGPPQGLFLNAVVEGQTSLSPHDLLRVCQCVEKDLGRVRTVKDGPRTLDVDILLYDHMLLSDFEITIPHPRMWKRNFVTIPLNEIAPHLSEEDFK